MKSESADRVTTAWDYLQSHLNLERLAREQMPYDPKECTFALGPLRQPLFACLTCQREQNSPNAVCYACSIKCHTTHELVELFTKRGRTCDCGTSRVQGPCFVRNPQWLKLIDDGDSKYEADIPDSCNSYGHNFLGNFCDCQQPYNPMLDSNMIQCAFGVACDEDWYHEECILGVRPGVIERNPRRIAKRKLLDIKEESASREYDDTNQINNLGEPGLDAQTENSLKLRAENDLKDQEDEDNNKDDDELNILQLPGFPDLDSFESLVCWKCDAMFKKEFDMMLNVLDDCDVVFHVKAESLDKRLALLHGETNDKHNKRVRKEWPRTIFLKDGYKPKLNNYLSEATEDTELVKLLNRYPFLHKEESVYEPPLDDEDDESSSVYDLGIQQIKNLPPDQAALGMMAINKLQNKLKEFLTPFAKDGEIVTEEAVNDFFKREMKYQ